MAKIEFCSPAGRPSFKSAFVSRGYRRSFLKLNLYGRFVLTRAIMISAEAKICLGADFTLLNVDYFLPFFFSGAANPSGTDTSGM